MTETRAQVFALAIILLAVGAASVAAHNSGEEDAALREIAGYKDWTRVTENPLPVENSLPGG